MSEKRKLVEPRRADCYVTRQCELLSLSRSSYYYLGAPLKSKDYLLLRVIDQEFMDDPTLGSRGMALRLQRIGYPVGRKRMRRLMRHLGIAAIYQKSKTSVAHPAHRKFPYLLRERAITRPNQVWCADITYIPMRRGHLYLVAVMDWYSRKVLAWRLSNTMDPGFCVEALQEALARYGKPEIFNTDQGSQFTCTAFIGALEEQKDIQISMDGRGRWMDNVMIERLWRSLKYGTVYLHDWEKGSDARHCISRWVERYNYRRPHTSLENRTPDEAYRGLPAPTRPVSWPEEKTAHA